MCLGNVATQWYLLELLLHDYILCLWLLRRTVFPLPLLRQHLVFLLFLSLLCSYRSLQFLFVCCYLLLLLLQTFEQHRMSLIQRESQAVALPNLSFCQRRNVIPEVVVIVEVRLNDGHGRPHVLVVLVKDLVILVGDSHDLQKPVAVSEILLQSSNGFLIRQSIGSRCILFFKLSLHGGFDLLRSFSFSSPIFITELNRVQSEFLIKRRKRLIGSDQKKLSYLDLSTCMLIYSTVTFYLLMMQSRQPSPLHGA